MKTMMRLSMPLCFAILAFTACNKESISAEEVINASVSSDGTYSYELPASSEQLQITQQASHAENVALTSSGSTKALFTYSPVTTYSGTDEVKIAANENTSSGGKQCNGGGSKKHAPKTYVFKIQVKEAEAQ